MSTASSILTNTARVPHISLVFREMWDTTNLNLKLFRDSQSSRTYRCGIPHLAKNERDVGHPSSVAEESSETEVRRIGRVLKPRSVAEGEF
jgi:hypothetical protein